MQNKIILFIIGFSLIVIGFAIAKITSSTKKEIVLPDYSKYEKKQDSLFKVIKQREDTVIFLNKLITELTSDKVDNHKNLKNDISKIKKFNNFYRVKYIDSIFGEKSK